ncbi:DUF2274 domain-containing protein [Mesorhizobium sp.]|uniref:DUF2274 domain-containing protein n=1 Tax=Mesorhizobium sp. TaxID=1871066 RepID=UPI000FE61806|nr:DUF2274 domain-containing protein [Mesorhizobium sp.]TGQ66245.1 DUF2274 domain-containing protein [bacterium M00.F.Ca.ET.205.01.1.1]TGU49640.1 DUF2274 domain-containing protein [bacterium M00.F.Ca.ET.152.01.1.1]TGV33737.1 DUF2274 domain-containing protein [Mesorhizobium sp. M00.F.Ca.ET.186.01.1.1]TGZ40642.1 DUF2274 domain-containing protein [bacterium M00.F.Ca.ET.162.01.1.1]RWA62002.1 MAG: DUF2274 domain-containing protein [Mesorhizobium sp.]
MSNLKLGRLPDRTPSKITITVSADLGQALNDYAALYRQTYGESETVAELIPYMLVEFVESDRAFAKARKEGLPGSGVSEKPRRQSVSTADNAQRGVSSTTRT